MPTHGHAERRPDACTQHDGADEEDGEPRVARAAVFDDAIGAATTREKHRAPDCRVECHPMVERTTSAINASSAAVPTRGIHARARRATRASTYHASLPDGRGTRAGLSRSQRYRPRVRKRVERGGDAVLVRTREHLLYPAAMRVGARAAAANVDPCGEFLPTSLPGSGLERFALQRYPVKAVIRARDLERICRRDGVSFQRPSRFPPELRGASPASVAESWGPDFVRAVYHANFAEDQRPASPRWLLRRSSASTPTRF